MRRSSAVIWAWLACSPAVSLIPSAALAQAGHDPRADAERGPWYLQARGGVFVPRQDQAYEETGPDAEITVGRLLLPRFALEASVGIATSSVEGRLLYTDPPGSTSWTGTATLTVLPMTLSARGFFPVGPVTLSALGGVGVYYTDSSVEYEGRPTGPGLGPNHGSAKDFSPGVHVGGAAAVGLSPRFSLGVDLRYFFVRAKLMEVAKPPTVNVTLPDGNESTGRVYGLQSSVALTYRL